MAFRLDAQDEFPHVPDAAPNFNESVYVNAFDWQARVGGWMRLGNRVNEGHAELSVCLYLPGGRIACAFGRPSISSNERFDAGGLRVETSLPLYRQEWAFDGELLLLEDPQQLRDPKTMFATAPRYDGHVRWELIRIAPPHGGEPVSDDVETMYGREFARGHFNQHVRVGGELRVGPQTWPLGGFGWRDHSWGPRLWQNIHWYRLFLVNLGPDRAAMLLKIADPSGRVRHAGVILADGEYEEITALDVTTEWTAAKDPASMTLTFATARRSGVIEGRVRTLAPLRNRRDGVTSRVAEGFTEFTWDGRTGYGMTEYIERLDADGTPVGWPD